ncbi:MAG TPA: PspC domain-containing protein [Ignavibacteriales bacterium]|nr:PspC domain-containing protein [Ignavibacteriales bacterium]
MEDKDTPDMPDEGEDSERRSEFYDPFADKEKDKAEEAHIIEEINEPKKRPVDDYDEDEDEEERPSRRITRSARNRFLLGACGGLAEFLHIDPIVFRLVFIIAFAFTYWTAAAYLILAFFMPEPSAREIENAQGEVNPRFGKSSLITLIFVLFGVYYFADYMSFFGAFGVFNLLQSAAPPSMLALAAYYYYKYGTAEPAAESDKPKEYCLSNTDRKMGGVCGGLAEYLNADPSTIRAIWTLFSILTLGIGVALYLIFLFASPRSTEYSVD